MEKLTVLRRQSRNNAGVGFYTAPDDSQYPKLQLCTVEELLDGKTVDYPRYKFDATHKKATRKSKKKSDKQIKMDI